MVSENEEVPKEIKSCLTIWKTQDIVWADFSISSHTIYDGKRVCGLGDVELDFLIGLGSFPVEALDDF